MEIRRELTEKDYPSLPFDYIRLNKDAEIEEIRMGNLVIIAEYSKVRLYVMMKKEGTE